MYSIKSTLRICFSAILVLFISFSSYGQLLWEISGNGLSKPSYLYGTIHISDARVFKFGPSVLPSLKTVDAYAGEIILDESAIIPLITKLYMSGDTTLSMLLSSKQYSEVKNHVSNELGMMGVYMADRIKPIFVSTLLTTQAEDEKEALDLYLQRISKEEGKEVIGIETIEEQMNAIDAIPLKTQADLLYKDILARNKGYDPAEEMIKLYCNQDLDALYSITEKEMPEVMKKFMLLDRNSKMAQRIHSLIPKKSVFFGIGAAHLPGKNGLIQLLKNKGYTLKAIY